MFCAVAIQLSCASEKQGVRSPETADQTGETDASDTEFVVTQDIYAQTFSEVEAFISVLNELIREKNYDEWIRFLSADYMALTSSPEFLREASQSSILVKNRIVLKDLRDYFLYVVVPSRSQAVLSDISFIDEKHVKAITVIDGKPVILYMLVKEEARWMVGVW